MKKQAGIFLLFKPYKKSLCLILLLALLGNSINLLLPKLISDVIDGYRNGMVDTNLIAIRFIGAAFSVFAFSLFQSILQTYTAEVIGRDLRTQLTKQLSFQEYTFIESVGSSRLLTNFTSDIDSIKFFISQAVISIFSSMFIIVGVCIWIFLINWKLALAVMTIIPLIGITFFIILKKVRWLYKKSRETLDWLNRIISETILGAAFIRILNSQNLEYNKFIEANTQAKEIGLSILRNLAVLIPLIILISNIAVIIILAAGGHLVINGSMTIGQFSAFNSYLSMLIFPILIIGLMTNAIAQARASYHRIELILDSKISPEKGLFTERLKGNIEVKNVSIQLGHKPVLKNISFTVTPGLKTAIVGPTAAGKTQLLYALIGLNTPVTGSIQFDGHQIDAYVREPFFNQVGLVFQDSIIYNMSIAENIAFNNIADPSAIEKAIQTAELKNYINTLPDGLNTVVSENGNNLSGGQKQRIMLARALSIDPVILLLDDFTARVDIKTEQKIITNIQQNYPGITLISVTQKISSIKDYDNIIVLIEGEVIANGTHRQLIKTCPEYIQIFNSQLSLDNYGV